MYRHEIEGVIIIMKTLFYKLNASFPQTLIFERPQAFQSLNTICESACNPMNLIDDIYLILIINSSKINYKLMPTYEAFLSINPFNSKFWRSQSFDFLEKAK